jgi:tetratricopeptide (TPR) repeat protein
MARHGEAGPRVAGPSVPVLEAAAQRDPDDLAAEEELGFALALQGRWQEAAARFASALSKAPGREVALMGAAGAAEELGRVEDAIGLWRRAAAASPWRAEYRRDLAQLLVKSQRWDEARPECEAWVRLDPFSPEARVARVQCLLATGDKEAARAEFARVEALAPNNLIELQARLRRKLQ